MCCLERQMRKTYYCKRPGIRDAHHVLTHAKIYTDEEARHMTCKENLSLVSVMLFEVLFNSLISVTDRQYEVTKVLYAKPHVDLVMIGDMNPFR